MYDLMIMGSGLVGSALALALSKNNWKILLIDKVPLEQDDALDLDGRTSALSLASNIFLDRLGLGNQMPLVPIESIHVSNGKHLLTYDQKDPPMGTMVKNIHLKKALHKAVRENSSISFMICETPPEIKVSDFKVTLELQDGQCFEAPLLVGADGRASAIREWMGVESWGWSYEQHGIVGTVRHSKPHHNRAFEHFTPRGPLAFLPYEGDTSAYVWTLPSNDVQDILSFPALEKLMEEIFGDHLGTLEMIDTPISYPLSGRIIKDYVGNRCVLVGDAAHVIHPVAGQGVNLGFKDAAVLCDVLNKSRDLGLDYGHPVTLKKYQEKRRFDNLSMTAVTHLMVKGFSNQSTLLRLFRGRALSAMNRFPSLKEWFKKNAMGVMGEIPSLMQQEAIK